MTQKISDHLRGTLRQGQTHRKKTKNPTVCQEQSEFCGGGGTESASWSSLPSIARFQINDQASFFWHCFTLEFQFQRTVFFYAVGQMTRFDVPRAKILFHSWVCSPYLSHTRSSSRDCAPQVQNNRIPGNTGSQGFQTEHTQTPRVPRLGGYENGYVLASGVAVPTPRGK